MWKAVCAVVFLATTNVAAASDEEIKQAMFSARVTVAADGHATVGELAGPTGALAQVVAAKLAETKFVPAMRDGVPIAADAQVHGRAVLTPMNADEYEVALRDVTTNPAFKRALPPDYPVDRSMVGASGSVELLLRVDAYGQVSDAVVVSSSHPSFEKAVRKVARTWTFEPPLGETSVVVPVIFREVTFPKGRRTEDPVFQCALDRARPNVAGATGCTDAIKSVGMRIRRSI
jgi:TonB family protein